MGRNKKIIIVVGVVVILGLILWLILRNSNKNKGELIKTFPTPTQIEEGDYEEVDGATDISVSEGEQNILDKMSQLRDKLPIKNDQFSLYFSYKINKFIVFYKDSGINNFDILKDWLITNNFVDIPMENFVIAGKGRLANAGSSTFALNYLLPFEEDDFIVMRYLKDKVLLVKAKNNDLNKAKVSLKKWLDLVEEKPGENIIVWQ